MPECAGGDSLDDLAGVGGDLHSRGHRRGTIVIADSGYNNRPCTPGRSSNRRVSGWMRPSCTGIYHSGRLRANSSIQRSRATMGRSREAHHTEGRSRQGPSATIVWPSRIRRPRNRPGATELPWTAPSGTGFGWPTHPSSRPGRTLCPDRQEKCLTAQAGREAGGEVVRRTEQARSQDQVSGDLEAVEDPRTGCGRDGRSHPGTSESIVPGQRCSLSSSS